MSTAEAENGSASWALLGNELKRRTLQPAKHVSFTLYFFTAVVLLGGAGVWLEIYSLFLYAPKPDKPTVSGDALRTAVITFFPALAGTSCMQLVWENDDSRSLRAFATSILIIMLVAAIAISPATVSTSAALWVGTIASGVAFWIWWIANAKQKGLLDTVDPYVATGKKDPKAELSGSLDGFKV